jgi:hypothetical protein
MNDSRDDDAARVAAGFRPNVRPLLIAVIANVVLAGLLLGVPYARGHAQTERSLRAFARFAGCLFGGRPQAQLGLGLPSGDRAHFAAQVMRAKPDWPARCRTDLRAVAPEEAIFLWPSIKLAATDVRAAVALLDRELLALARTRQVGAAGRVPARPLLAVAKLQGTLTLLARAGDADAAIDGNAVVFGPDANVIDPSRLPLVAGSSAALEVWPGQDGLHALAMDGGGISWLRVEGGTVARSRVRRTSLVRGALRDGDRPLLVWAMSEERCAAQEDRCVRRGTGIAHIEHDALQLPRPIWLAGHPAGRVDRSLRIGVGGRVDLLARDSSEGALELRRFELPTQTPWQAMDAAEQAPLPASQRLAVPAAPPSDAQLLQGQPATVVYAVPAAGAAREAGGTPESTNGAGAGSGAPAAMAAWLWTYEEGADPILLGRAGGAGGWVEACSAGSARWVAFGTESELALARVHAQVEPSTPLPASAFDIGALVPRDESGRDRVRVLCEAERATLVVLARDRTLQVLRCDPDSCVRTFVLARGVTGFDAALTADDVAVLAYARSDQPQVTVVRVDAGGAVLGDAQTPAPCWDPTGGMCGQPTLVAAPGRLLLCARDGSDLVALESPDGGQRWRPLSGLKVSNAISTDAHAPMQQHRIRKGLD